MSDQRDGGIAWTEITLNPWWGCTEWGPDCDACYARTLSGRFGKAAWGKGKERWFRLDAAAREARAADRRARRSGERTRAFSLSMGDVFDVEVPQEVRGRWFDVIRETTALEWLLLSKRYGTEDVLGMLPVDWGSGWGHVRLGVSFGDQKTFERRAGACLDVPARSHFASYEPAFGPVVFGDSLGEIVRWDSVGREIQRRPGFDLVIVGGESGPGARPFDLGWARETIRQCRAAGVAVFMKQDSGPRSGMQGRIPNELWIKEWPSDHRPREAASSAKALP